MASPIPSEDITFGIYVTASQGCEHAEQILRQILDFKSEKDTITVLELEESDCLAKKSSPLGLLPHKYFDTEDEFAMRLAAASANVGTHTLVIEDHMAIDANFLPSLREFLSSYKELPALGFYAANGTSANFGSRILFTWIFGLASLDQWPRSPEPVCSAFLLNNHFFSTYVAGLNHEIAVGEMESHVIPYVVPRVSGLMPKALHVEHSQKVSIFRAAQGVYENSRISAHLERETNLLLWMIILLQRHFFRYLKIMRATRPAPLHSLGVFFLANVGFLGGIVGRFGSLGGAYRRLARTHTQLRNQANI